MRFKVVVFGEHSCTDELFLENGYEVEKVFWGVVTYVIYFIRWNWEAVFALLLLWGVLHHSYYTFHDVIDIGEVALTVAVVENLDGFAFNKFVGETEVCHVRATGWTIDGEETETGGWDVIEFAVGMSHKLVTLLSGCVKRHRVIYLVIGRIRHLLVTAIY